MLRVQMVRRHRENEAVFLTFEAGGIVSAVRIDHAFGEGSGVDQFGQCDGEVIVLFFEAVLGAQDDAHVGEGSGFGVGAGGIAGEFGLVGGGWGGSGGLCE